MEADAQKRTADDVLRDVLEVVEAHEELPLALVGVFVDRVGSVLHAHELEHALAQVRLPAVVLRLDCLGQVRVELQHVREVHEQRRGLCLAHHFRLVAVVHRRRQVSRAWRRVAVVSHGLLLLTIPAEELQEPRLHSLGCLVHLQLHLRAVCVWSHGRAIAAALGAAAAGPRPIASHIHWIGIQPPKWTLPIGAKSYGRVRAQGPT